LLSGVLVGSSASRPPRHRHGSYLPHRVHMVQAHIIPARRPRVTCPAAAA